jgi:HAD superfamily phosphoserine phosphatase-like hydrolase
MLAALTHAVDSMEEHFHRMNGGMKNAVFDLDNTLLMGDIGDALFAHMLNRGYNLDFSWSQYQQLQRENPAAAFTRVITSMKQFHYLTIEETTLSAMAPHAVEIMIDDCIVPVPRPHPVMQEFIRLLRRRGYRTLIVSASNQFSVRVVAREFFDIPECDAYGIEPDCDESGLLTGKLIDPVPIHHGKVATVRKILGNTPPLITAGDSMLDLPMLRLCHERGLVIWAGSPAGMGHEIVNDFPDSQSIFFMPSVAIC